MIDWWWVLAAFLAPWLRMVVQPSITIRAAGLWGISMLGTGMVGVILSMGAARYARVTGAAVPPEWSVTAVILSAAVMLSGAIILAISAIQADAADRRRHSAP